MHDVFRHWFLFTSVFALGRNAGMAHDAGSELVELASNEWFGHVVSKHIISWTVLCLEVTLCNLVSHKEAPNVQVSSSLAQACLAILLQSNGTLVVLMEDILFDWTPLCFQEQPTLQHDSHAIIHCNHLSCCGAPCHCLLLV